MNWFSLQLEECQSQRKGGNRTCNWESVGEKGSILSQLYCENSPVEKRTATVPLHEISWFSFKTLKSNMRISSFKKNWKIQLWHRKDKWFSMMCLKSMMEKRTKFNTWKAITEVRNWLKLFSFQSPTFLKRRTGWFVLWKGLKEIQYYHNRQPLPPKIMKTRWHEVF